MDSSISVAAKSLFGGSKDNYSSDTMLNSSLQTFVCHSQRFDQRLNLQHSLLSHLIKDPNFNLGISNPITSSSSLESPVPCANPFPSVT